MGEIAGLYWEEHGPSDGPPVILSAGLGGSADYWAPNLEALAKGHRVILYDHRGTGRPERALPPNLTVTHMAQDVLAIADALDLGRFALVGHAAGGAIGLQLAVDHPERISVVIAINAFAKAEAHFRRCMKTRLALLSDSGVAAFVHAQPIFLYPADWCSANAERLMAEEAAQLRHFQGAANVEARIGALLGFDLADRLGEILSPVVAIVADDDMLVPHSCSIRIMEGVKGGVVHRMPWGGHACNLTNPAEFDDIVLNWLAVHLKGGQ